MWSLLLGCQYYGDQVSFELPNTAREILNFGTLQFLTCPDYSQHWEFTIVDLHGRGNPHWMWHAVFSFWSWHSSHWSCLHCQIGKDGGGYNPNLLIFFCDASAHVENLCPEISQILPAGNTPRFAWRELRPQGPRAISVSPWPDRSWGDQWHGWRGAIPPDQRCQRGNPRNGGFIMEKSSMTKKNSLIKLPSLILRGIWVGGPLFWGFWRFGVALQMLILLPKNLSWTSPDPGSSVANGRCTKTLGWRRSSMARNVSAEQAGPKAGFWWLGSHLLGFSADG